MDSSSHVWHKKIGELSKELDRINAADTNPTFCVKKIYAVASKDLELYLNVVDDELEAKKAEIELSVRDRELSREIVERLRLQMDSLQEQQSEVIGWLRDARDAASELGVENARLREDLSDSERRLDAATGLLADSAGAEAGLNVLISNLEEENRRCTVAAERAQQRVSDLRRELELAEAAGNRYKSEADYWRRRWMRNRP